MIGELVPRRVLGVALQAAAVVAAVALLSGAVVGWRILGAVKEATDRSTQVALAVLDAVDMSLTAADELLSDSRSTLVASVDTLERVQGSLDDATEVTASVGELAGTSAPAVAATRRTLQDLEGVGRAVDSALAALSRLPIGPDYDPGDGFGATVAQMVDDLEPLPGALQSTAQELDDLTAEGALLEEDLDELSDALDEIVVELQGSDELLVGFREAAAEARRLAVDSGGLGVELALGRLIVVTGAVALAVVQVVPFRRGTRLRHDVSDLQGEPG